jgi:hypothetical protein
MQGSSPVAISSWIRDQNSPVIILHHETPSNYHFIHRSLTSTNPSSNTTVTPLTEFQISDYQVIVAGDNSRNRLKKLILNFFKDNSMDSYWSRFNSLERYIQRNRYGSNP